MLAEPRQKRSYLLTPRGQPLYEDENRFGSRMLEKMGWSKGKGLGVNEDGSQDFVRLRYKQDSKGLGFQDRDDQWTQHEDSFDGLLKSLNDGNVNCEKISESEIPRINFASQGNRESIETAANTSKKLKEKTSGMSLEERSRKSKARVHYKKFTKGKDLTQYSEKDLANIFGKTFTEEKKVTNQGDIKTPSLVDNYFTSKTIAYETNPFNTTLNHEIIEDNMNKENMRKKKVEQESGYLIKEREILKSKDKKRLVSDNVADKSEAFKGLAVKTSALMIDEDSPTPSSKKKSVKPLSKPSDTEADNSNLTKICIEAVGADITRVKKKKTAIGVQEAYKAVKTKPNKREVHDVHEGVENNADTRKVHLLEDVGNELEMEHADPSTDSSKKKITQAIYKSNDRETDDSNLTKGSIEDVATEDITRGKRNETAIAVRGAGKAVQKKSSKRKVHVGDEGVEIHALSDVGDELQVFKEFDAEKSPLAVDVDSSKPLSKKKTVKSVKAVPTEASRLKWKSAAMGVPGTDKVAKKKSNKRKRDAVHETIENNADTKKVRLLDNVGNELEMLKQFESKNCVSIDDADSSKTSSKKEIVSAVIRSNDVETCDNNLKKVDLETIPADINRVKQTAKGVQESNKAGKKKGHAVGEAVENNADTGEVRAVNEAIVDVWTSPTGKGCNKAKNKEKNSKKQKKGLLVDNEENRKHYPSKKPQHQSESEINLDSLIVQNCATNTCLDESEKLSIKQSSLNILRLKHEKSNTYEISSFCAEKFRNADIQKFPGSSLSQVEGYSLSANTVLDIQDKRNDEERITNLWRCTLDKYNQLEKPKKTYQGYVKQVIQAKIHKQKGPKLYVKSWKRKSAFQPI